MDWRKKVLKKLTEDEFTKLISEFPPLLKPRVTNYVGTQCNCCQAKGEFGRCVCCGGAAITFPGCRVPKTHRKWRLIHEANIFEELKKEKDSSSAEFDPRKYLEKMKRKFKWKTITDEDVYNALRFFPIKKELRTPQDFPPIKFISEH